MRSNCSSAENSTCAGSTDLVPYPTHLHGLMLDLAKTLPTVSAGTSVATAKKKQYLSRNMAKTFVEAARKTGVDCERFHAWASLVADEAVTWKQVVSVESIPDQTGYDLTVPGPYTFATAGGVIVQDTLNVHAVYTPEAVKNVKETLFPSRNLFHSGTFDTHLEPMQDYVAGLHLATTPDPNGKVVTFDTAEDAKKAYMRGTITARTPIRIRDRSAG